MEEKTKNLLYVIGGFFIYADPITKSLKYKHDELSDTLNTGFRTAGILAAFEGLRNLGLDVPKAAGVVIVGAAAIEWGRRSRMAAHGVTGQLTGWDPWERHRFEREHEHREEPWHHHEDPFRRF